MSQQVVETTECEWCGQSLEELRSASCKELCTDCTGETVWEKA